MTGLTASDNRRLYAKAVLQLVEGGDVDQHLRVIFDAVVARKKLLDRRKKLPPQATADDLPADDVAFVATPAYATVNPDAPVVEQQVTRVVPPPQPAPTLSNPAPIRRGSGRTFDRPDASATPYTGKIHPLTIAQQNNHLDHDPVHQVSIGGRVFDKRLIRGKVFDYAIDGAIIRFQAVGVGPKAVQALVVVEPPTSVQVNKKSLWQAWNSNRPVYLPHAAIAHMLDL